MAMTGGNDDGTPMMEMNTTPLIDVMLVLLIMFIITIPPITHAVDIDLPVPSPDEVPDPVEPIVNQIIVEQSNQLLWNGQPASLDQVAQYLRQTKSMAVEPELQFQPDPNANYDTVDRVLAEVRKSEITKFGFVGNEQYRVFDKADNAP
ncbi:MAG: biopolymer transporter ExbD [Sphingorhabdus sp.]